MRFSAYCGGSHGSNAVDIWAPGGKGLAERCPNTKGQVMSAVSEATRCVSCRKAIARLDEHERCEQCVMDAEHVAAALLSTLEDFVRDALQAAVTPDQLREALEMSITDKGGMLSSGGFHREIVGAPLERGFWTIVPGSSFLDDDEPRRKNRIRQLRNMSVMSTETVAEKIGVSVDELASWESDVLPREDQAQAFANLCNLFGVMPAFLLGGAPPPLDDTTGGAVA